MLDSDSSCSSDGSPQSSLATVQELKRQLAEAKQQASSDLASAARNAEVDLAAAQAATLKLQAHCSKLDAELAGLQRSCQMPCAPWVSAEWLSVLTLCCAPLLRGSLHCS